MCLFARYAVVWIIPPTRTSQATNQVFVKYKQVKNFTLKVHGEVLFINSGFFSYLLHTYYRTQIRQYYRSSQLHGKAPFSKQCYSCWAASNYVHVRVWLHLANQIARNVIVTWKCILKLNLNLCVLVCYARK